MSQRVRAQTADRAGTRLRSRLAEGRVRRRSLRLTAKIDPPPGAALPGGGSRPVALRRYRHGPLVVHDLADADAILVGEARRIRRQVGAGCHAALDRRPFAQFLEPALEIFEFLD